MIRMKGAEISAPPVEETPLPVEEAPVEEAPAPALPMMGGQADPAVAGYKGPEMGPFACGNCHFYDGNNECVLVSGPIDEAGLCNLFTPMSQAGPAEAPLEEMPAEMPEEPLPVDAPVV